MECFSLYIWFYFLLNNILISWNQFISLMHFAHCLHRGYVFRAQTQEIKERGGNQSTGIDFFITQERVIFLDTQVRIRYWGYKSSLWSIFSLLTEYLQAWNRVQLDLKDYLVKHWCNKFCLLICFFSPCWAHLFWTTSSTTTGSCLQSTISLTLMLRCRSVASLQRAVC